MPKLPELSFTPEAMEHFNTEAALEQTIANGYLVYNHRGIAHGTQAIMIDPRPKGDGIRADHVGYGHSANAERALARAEFQNMLFTHKRRKVSAKPMDDAVASRTPGGFEPSRFDTIVKNDRLKIFDSHRGVVVRSDKGNGLNDDGSPKPLEIVDNGGVLEALTIFTDVYDYSTIPGVSSEHPIDFHSFPVISLQRHAMPTKQSELIINNEAIDPDLL